MTQIYPSLPKEIETLPTIAVTERIKSKPLFRQKLIKLFIQIIVFHFVIAVATFIILCLRYSITKYSIKHSPFQASDIQYFVSIFVISITIFSLPLSLPVTLALIFHNFIKKMKADNILVKRFLTFGSIDDVKSVICSSQYLNGADVSAAMAEFEQAGIQVRIISTDNIDIAREKGMAAGILKFGDPSERIMDRSEFYARICDSTGKISQELFDQIWPNLRILANAEPSDNIILMSSQHEKIAFIGDDLQALQAADIVFTSNDEIAKNDNDIVVIDQNFNTIFRAFTCSQHISAIIIIVIEFQLSIFFISMTLSLIGKLAINASIITFIQYIWINTVTCTISYLAFTSSPAKESLIEFPETTKSFISRKVLKKIFINSPYPITIFVILIFLADRFIPNLDNGRFHEPGASSSKHFTFIFNTFVLIILFNGLFHRQKSEKSFFKKMIGFVSFWIVWILILLLQIFIVCFGGESFSTSPLEWYHWIICVIFATGEHVLKGVFTTVSKLRHRHRAEVQPAYETENVKNNT